MPADCRPSRPPISARGTSAATESMTRMSIATRTDQRIGDFQRLLARIRLRNQEIFEIDPELSRIDRIECVFGIDEAADAALLLCLGNGLQRQRGLAPSFPDHRSR